jgi:hypothetical protein
MGADFPSYTGKYDTNWYIQLSAGDEGRARADVNDCSLFIEKGGNIIGFWDKKKRSFGMEK